MWSRFYKPPIISDVHPTLIGIAGFNIPLDTLQVTSDVVSSAIHLTAAKDRPSLPIIWLVLAKPNITTTSDNNTKPTQLMKTTVLTYAMQN